MVSGAGRGIGARIARTLHSDGFLVSVGLRDPDTASEIVDDLRDKRFCARHYDALDDGSAGEWVAATIRTFGKIDGLINNAGIWSDISIQDGPLEELDRLWRVNVRGPFLLTRLVFDYLKSSGTGRVVNIASASGKRVAGTGVGYTMSKHAIVALAHQVRRDGWEYGVRATALCPGMVNTGMGRQIPTGRDPKTMTQPDDFAQLVSLLLVLPNSSSIAEIAVQSIYEATL